MKNIKYIVLLTMMFATQFEIKAQEIVWQFAEIDSVAGGCTSLSEDNDGIDDKICFFIEYTPQITGNLTSYTMGMLANCVGGGNPVFSTVSCDITNNSEVLDGCSELDSVLIQVSGFGNLDVVAFEPIVLHQVCFQLSEGDIVNMKMDDILGISTSIDSADGGGPFTEEVVIDSIEVTNNYFDCFQLSGSGGKANQTVECLSSITPIEYNLVECAGASITGLAPGLSFVLINGVINIEGSPSEAGTFTFTLSPDAGCDCETQTGTITVGNSRVMINNVCYDAIEPAIDDYLSGQVIDIFGDLITESGLAPLTEMNIRLHAGINWTVKE